LAVVSLQYLQANHDAKAELNRRSQACEVLTGTGIRVVEIEPPLRLRALRFSVQFSVRRVL